MMRHQFTVTEFLERPDPFPAVCYAEFDAAVSIEPDGGDGWVICCVEIYDLDHSRYVPLKKSESMYAIISNHAEAYCSAEIDELLAEWDADAPNREADRRRDQNIA